MKTAIVEFRQSLLFFIKILLYKYSKRNCLHLTNKNDMIKLLSLFIICVCVYANTKIGGKNGKKVLHITKKQKEKGLCLRQETK